VSGVAAVALGGAVGAVGRYLLGSWIEGATGPAFPWSTLSVNLLGSLLLGFLMVWLQAHAASPATRQLLAVGLLGSFTTFSTYSYQTVTLLRDGALLRAGTYAAGSLLLGLVAVAAGMALAQAMVGPISETTV